MHKALIAVGPRRSERLGRRIREAEAATRDGVLPHERSSEAHVHETVMLEGAADAMSAALDFCYYPDRPLDITANNAVPLVYLGKRYKIRALLEQAEEYVIENLKRTTAMCFLLDSYLYKLDDVCQRAIDVTAAHLYETTDFEPIYRLTPELFRRTILSKKLKCESEMLSLIVYSYCGECEYSVFLKFFHSNKIVMQTLLMYSPFLSIDHSEEIDLEYFRELTKTRIMPGIDSKIALMILNFYCTLILEDDENCNIMKELQGDSLMNRCVSVIAEHWQGEVCDPLLLDDSNTPAVRKLALPPHSGPAALHRDLPPTLQNFVLEKCILAAKLDVDSQKSTVENFEEKKKEEIENSNKNFAHIVKQMQAELEKSKKVQDRNTEDYRSQIEQLQQRTEELEAQLESNAQLLNTYKQELTCFRRVPGIHNFGEVLNQGGRGANTSIIDKTKCTYSANPDHHYPNHRRGNRPPTQMPKMGTEFGNLGKENGYLYDDNGTLLPVFYYQRRSSAGSGLSLGGSA